MSGINFRDKFYWLALIELIGGFTASVAFMGVGGLRTYYGKGGELRDIARGIGQALDPEQFKRADAEKLKYWMVDILVDGAFLSVLLRYLMAARSLQSSQAALAVLFVFTMVMYLAGGIIIFLVNDKTDAILRGVFAVIVSLFLFIDMLCNVAKR